jgi:hemerythrin superfamily protein
MSFLDRIAAAVTPAASDEQRAEAREKAEKLAASEPWLATILDQHRRIEGLVTQGLTAQGTDARRQTVKELATVLTGHATAEEAVLYPDVSEFSGKTHAGMGYEEHAMTKVQLAKLEKIDPASEEWREKLEHIQSALQQHMYQEEDSWLPDLAENMPPAEKSRLTQRFNEEFERYCGSGSAHAGAENRPAMPLSSAP